MINTSKKYTAARYAFHSQRAPYSPTYGWTFFLDFQVRLRPVFVLSEGFCRAHGLPHKRLLRPPLLMESPEVVNYTKLAIRYTSFMTKDVIYVALRDVIRRVSSARKASERQDKKTSAVEQPRSSWEVTQSIGKMCRLRHLPTTNLHPCVHRVVCVCVYLLNCT